MKASHPLGGFLISLSSDNHSGRITPREGLLPEVLIPGPQLSVCLSDLLRDPLCDLFALAEYVAEVMMVAGGISQSKGLWKRQVPVHISSATAKKMANGTLY